MKRFTLISLLVLFATMGFAQRHVDFKSIQRMTANQNLLENLPMFDRAAAPKTMSKAPRKATTVTPPAKDVEAWYVAGGNYGLSVGNGQVEDYTAAWASMGVIIDGNDIYLQGLAYYFKEAWVKGTISGSKVTIPSGQLLGTDQYGDEYLVGFNLETNAVSDVIFTYDSEKGTLTLDPNIYILENKYQDKPGYYGFWAGLVLSKEAPADPEVVVAPDKEAEDWTVAGYEVWWEKDEESGEYQLQIDEDVVTLPLKVIVDGSDIYMSGVNPFVEDAWVKGTKDGDNITFEGGQFMGRGDLVFPAEEEGGEETVIEDLPFYFNAYQNQSNTLNLAYNAENDMYLPAEAAYMFIEIAPNSFQYQTTIFGLRIGALKRMVDDGISTINSKKEANVFYNLQGVKMAKPAQKGIYIVNGKKVVVK